MNNNIKPLCWELLTLEREGAGSTVLPSKQKDFPFLIITVSRKGLRKVTLSSLKGAETKAQASETLSM